MVDVHFQSFLVEIYFLDYSWKQMGNCRFSMYKQKNNLLLGKTCFLCIQCTPEYYT